MISTNDTTILAMFSRYPEISDDEADVYLEQIEHEENREICNVLIGRQPENTLNQEQQRTYREFLRWSTDRTLRVRNEQIAARRRGINTRLRDRLLEMRDRGEISEEALLVYAVSGPLPQDFEFAHLSDRDKERFWEERVESNLGVRWREYLGTRADFMKMPGGPPKVDWAKEGF